MDWNKQNGAAAAAQDSDDLIAELARLVARDARDASARSDAYPRAEPAPVSEAPAAEASAASAPQAEPPYEPYEPSIPETPAPQAFDSGASQHAHDPVPDIEFDFGLLPERSKPSPDPDPIASLIADAEADSLARDMENDLHGDEDQGWVEDTSGSYDHTAQAEPAYTPPVAPDPSVQNESPARPVFQEPAPAPVEGDPLSEIEALIGEAARAGLDSGLSGRRVRSSFLDNGQQQSTMDAAEDAILAAVAAATAPAGSARDSERTEPDFGGPETAAPIQDYAEPAIAAPADPMSLDPAIGAPDVFEGSEDYEGEYESEYEAEERPRRRLGGLIVPMLAGTAILALAAGGYALFFAGSGDPGDAPVLLADADPLKEAVEVAAVETTATESVVFNEIEGNTTAPEDVTLVSRDQTNGASRTEIANVIGAEDGEIGLANRPVRTVTVRPDGTIVQAEDPLAGSAILPVDRPDVPDVPNSTLTADPIGEAIMQAMAVDAPEAGPVSDDAATDLPAIAGVAATAEPTVAEPEAVDGALVAPVPVPRPAGLVGQGISTATQPAAATVASVADPAPVTAQPAAATPAGAWVQLSSQRSEEVARAGIGELQTRYGALFGGATPEVSRVDLGTQGVYYRVRLPQPSVADANAVCSAIQGQGGDCFVQAN